MCIFWLPGAWILKADAGCMDFKEMCTRKDSRVHGFVLSVHPACVQGELVYATPFLHVQICVNIFQDWEVYTLWL